MQNFKMTVLVTSLMLSMGLVASEFDDTNPLTTNAPKGVVLKVEGDSKEATLFKIDDGPRVDSDESAEKVIQNLSEENVIAKLDHHEKGKPSKVIKEFDDEAKGAWSYYYRYSSYSYGSYFSYYNYYSYSYSYYGYRSHYTYSWSYRPYYTSYVTYYYYY
jgi:hypothetical protein